MISWGEGVDFLLGLSLLFTVLLGGAVVYLFTNQRHFQRVDYQQLIDTEEREKRQVVRLKHLERLIADMVAHDKRKRREMERLIQHTRRELADKVQRAREEIIAEVLREPAVFDNLLRDQAGVPAPAPELDSPAAQAPIGEAGSSRQMVSFPHNARQQRIVEMLEEGYAPREVAATLGLSQHEVEMVNAILFQSRTV